MGGENALRALARSRIAIEGVSIEIDGGRFSAKVVAGQVTTVEADIFSDGHDSIDAALLYRRVGSDNFSEAPMRFLENDRWQGDLVLDEPGQYEVTILAWRDLFLTWRKEVAKKHAAGQTIALELQEGRNLLSAALEPDSRADEAGRGAISALLAEDDGADGGEGHEGLRFGRLCAPETVDLMRQVGPRTDATRYKLLPVFADRKVAAFSAWYELMPRSQSGDEHRHGTFDDVIARLPYVRDLGFDVLYFPPIHPIGRTNRKGRNNTLTPGPDDPGSPYAIGSDEGGHDAIHPELGTFDDFRRLMDAARDHGLEIALDFAIQCSPDHPWIKEHPEWFDWRPDGTIKFAENPPKKYEDIVNVHFYRKALPDLWYALRDVVLFWVEHGVKIFRVDNPHTKPFPFWEWMITEVRTKHPDTIFLAEAFTRPKVMKRLAKVGFSQSYSYFTWRNSKDELTDYLVELTQTDSREVMRPNFFVNTPDINPRFLQSSGRPGFRTRLVLAATLGGNYGVYNGFEICDAAPVPGKEEYLDSEKYQIRVWDMDQPGNIQDDIRLMNRLRHEHPALQHFTNLKFYYAGNDQVLAYGKRVGDDFVLIHVNLDPHNVQSFQLEVPLWEFGLPDDASIEVRDLVHGNSFTWHGKYQWLELDPQTRPYVVWQLLAPGVAR
ncbi:MAG: alpha-1,4-glucan--maltose-1-phosphate maltosyltransferase [Paracoccus sp. (in: a-proteobacteria)]|uniref:alpha-1,4-glucan--maltose-1-phosphate maltosyltransferase n=1 Tax=Paracoccus sp. TaxID=267 RepID=UPI00405919ED